MIRRTLPVLALSFCSAFAASAQDARSALRAAVRAMGNVDSIEIFGHGVVRPGGSELRARR